jgi:4'-phosphopantetheinyl transferase
MAPDGLLAPDEEEQLARFTAPRRRRDWLLGRWTAKALLAQAAVAEGRPPLPAGAIQVLSGPAGEPVARVIHSDGESRPPLSISHRAGRAICATADRPGPLGADLELVESRAPGFAADFFTEDEIAWLETWPDGARDTLVTAIWSAKEAALKATGWGLTADTRVLSCRPRWLPAGDPDWQPLVLHWRPEATRRPAPALLGVWRPWGEFVLTLVAGSN